MKYFVVMIALLCIAAPASAQTPVSKDMADQYLANCLKQAPQPGLSAEGQKTVCACTAGRLPQFFTMEDWSAMTNSDPAVARPAANKMMVDVYAPCMEVPTREKYYALCAENPSVNQDMCKCTADSIAAYMKNNGSKVFGEILANNPMSQDPMAELEKNGNFMAYKEAAARNCIR